MRGPGRRRASSIQQFLFHQAVIAAHQHQRQLPIDDIHQRLDLPIGRNTVLLYEIVDGMGGRGVKPLWDREATAVLDRKERRGCLLHVGCVAARRAPDNQVLTGRRRAHELHRGAAAHRAA